MSIRKTISSSSAMSTRIVELEDRVRAGGAGGRVGVNAASAGGNDTRATVPAGFRGTSRISPPSSVTMLWQMKRPKPVPWPTTLVVTNGSKTAAPSAGSTPMPVSAISISPQPSARVRVDTWIECRPKGSANVRIRDTRHTPRCATPPPCPAPESGSGGPAGRLRSPSGPSAIFPETPAGMGE